MWKQYVLFERSSDYLIRLLKSVEQRLQSSKVSDKLEDPQNPHDPHKTDHLSRLANNLKVLQTLEEERQIEGDDGADVDNVHRVPDELELVGADHESHKELESEEDDDEVVCHLDDHDHYWPLALTLCVLLELVCGGDDEGDGGQDHHGQREQGQELGQLRRPWILCGTDFILQALLHERKIKFHCLKNRIEK